MFLIMSGAFVGQELESEFGKIPPSFLPLGNRRLFQHQIKLAPKGVDVFLSLPDTYHLSRIDEDWLTAKKVTILKIPENLSLGASLVAALNLTGHSLDKPLHVLYGDTLYRELPIGNDIASVSDAQGSYNWAVLSDDNATWLKTNQLSIQSQSQKIIDGYFKFSNPREIIKAITQCEWDFLSGLNRYHEQIGITPVSSNNWLDFGHVNTYYRSKSEFTTQRAFNELIITSKWIEKSSSKDLKIAAEANWFANIPGSIGIYTPQYLGSTVENGKTTYRLEYLHLTALNELFVFSKLPNNIWSKILSSCIEFLSECKKHKAPENSTHNSLNVLFAEKTEQRINQYCKSNSISRDKEWIYNDNSGITLNQVLNDSYIHLPKDKTLVSVLHGDFCFSNILYDFRSNRVKTIDPRGITPSGEKTIYGDLSYDIAKLSHSILGMYDWIIAGYYDVDINDYTIEFNLADEHQYDQIQHEFIELVETEFDLTAKNLYAMQIQLFLSMLPLHADNFVRQKALFANAFRLHQVLIRLNQ